MLAPKSYVVIDTETNHFKDPFVLQMGFCQVEEGKVVTTESFDVTPPSNIHITDSAAEVHGLTKESLAKSGSRPEDIFPTIHSTLKHFADGWLMGQNFVFDTGALNHTFQLYGLDEIDFESIRFLDVGVIFKAWRMMTEPGFGYSRSAARSPDQPLHDYFKWVRARRIRGLKWNIDFCMKHFEVEAEARGNHDAGEDCLLTHLIYQKMVERGIVEEVLFAE